MLAPAAIMHKPVLVALIVFALLALNVHLMNICFTENETSNHATQHFMYFICASPVLLLTITPPLFLPLYALELDLTEQSCNKNTEAAISL